MTICFSIIIPVFNRPEELGELLDSLQSCLAEKINRKNKTDSHSAGPFEFDIEVIVVEDGSGIRCENICRQFTKSLNLKYLYQENAGPAVARNTGAQTARGEWLLFFDSDCLIPSGYFDRILNTIAGKDIDFFGGPDRASTEFTSVQKAINYTMTSFLTTGGIRGGRKKLDRYYPRSFNMGVRREAFEKVGGFSNLRFGEDLDLSFRLMKAGYRSVLIDDAWVYHKRRTSLKQFYKQVYNSGMARIVLNKLHPGTLGLVHLLPSLFVLYVVAAIISIFFSTYYFWLPVALLLLIIVTDGLKSTGDIRATFFIPAAAMIQMTGYGTGFIHAFIMIYLLGRNKTSAFRETFYR